MGEEPSIASRVYGKQPKDVTTPGNPLNTNFPPVTDTIFIGLIG